MLRNIVIAVVILLVIVYIVNPDALTPWKDVAVLSGKATANAVHSAGESVEKVVRDGAHKDSIIDKSKDRVSDVIKGK